MYFVFKYKKIIDITPPMFDGCNDIIYVCVCVDISHTYSCDYMDIYIICVEFF